MPIEKELLMVNILQRQKMQIINFRDALWKIQATRRRRNFQNRLHRKLSINAFFYKKMIRTVNNQLIHKLNLLIRQRRFWKKNRSDEWWQCISNSDNADDWYENFRMKKETFTYLCDRLRVELEPSQTWVRVPLSVEKKVAISLYKLASCCEYRVVANQFGVHKSTVHNVLHQFCNAVIKILMSEEIKMPSIAEMQSISYAFEQSSNMPQIIGAIDGCHIPVRPAFEGHHDFINRKGWPSVVLQAVVDSNYRFRDVTCKHAGCTHDASVLRDSNLYKNFDSYERTSIIINGKEIKAYIVGDPAYPLLPWLIKPYISAMDAEEESFNTYLSKARIVVENAFGRLKGRWRMLQKKMDVEIAFAPKVIVACCILHNIIEKRNERYNSAWDTARETTDILYPQPSNISARENTLSGEVTRNTLKDYLKNNFPLISSRLR